MSQKPNPNANTNSVKFLYSYNGRILPRPSDGILRYFGGFTRVLSVHRSISFSELMLKFAESCGRSMILKCKLPNEDMDVLVSIKSDEDLRNVIHEYEKASPDAKIPAVLFPIDSPKKISPPSSPMSCFDFPSAKKPLFRGFHAPVSPCFHAPCFPVYRCCTPVFAYEYGYGYPVAGRRECCSEGRSTPKRMYHVPHRNYSH